MLVKPRAKSRILIQFCFKDSLGKEREHGNWKTELVEYN